MPLKKNVDEALTNPETQVNKVIVLKRTGGNVAWHNHRDIWWHEATATVSSDCPPEAMNAEDPLFILYTSGSTGKPKGVLHTTGGYLVYATLTFKYVFDYHEEDIYWCTADVGWVTGHSYLVYGPLANGATTIMFEGVPNYPATNRMSQVVDKHQVTILYTAPTAIRALMAKGNEAVTGTSRQSLRIMGSVGEPINPEAWEWYYRTIGDERCPIVDTWWQTETGGILITPLPGVTDLKPGSATRPFFGVQPALVDNMGEPLEGATEGNLVITDSWPGQMRTVFGDHERFEQTYFSTFPGRYFTGDGARRDEDGYYWITGRVDDVLNVSGHRMGTAEIESALVAHPKIAGSRGGGGSSRDQGSGYLCLCHPDRRGRAEPRAAQRGEGVGPQGDWCHRHAGRDPLGRGAAEDPFRQDHAPHLAQDRHRRDRQPGGYLHPGGSGGGRQTHSREVGSSLIPLRLLLNKAGPVPALSFLICQQTARWQRRSISG